MYFWKKERKTTPKTRIFYPCRTPKVPGKEGETAQNSEVSKRGRSKRGRTQKHAKARKRAQMSAKERKRKSAKDHKERKIGRKNCKQPGLKQPGFFWELPKNVRNSFQGRKQSETGRIRFRGVRFQTLSSVSFSGLTEFRGANSVSSSRPIICVPKRTHRVSRRTHRVCRRTQ